MKIFCGMMMVILLAVCANLTYLHNVDKRPTVEVWEINQSPFLFCADHSEILNPATSIIAKKSIGKKGDENKFHRKYKYAYVIRKHNRWFSREQHLEFHPVDAVDTNVVFSTRLPDPQLFIVQ